MKIHIHIHILALVCAIGALATSLPAQASPITERPCAEKAAAADLSIESSTLLFNTCDYGVSTFFEFSDVANVDNVDIIAEGSTFNGCRIPMLHESAFSRALPLPSPGGPALMRRLFSVLPSNTTAGISPNRLWRN
jgi:hypothetical protein